VEHGETLIVAANAMEAEVVAGLLQSAGIESLQRPLDVAITGWDPTGAGGAVEILVAPDDLDAARELLDSRAD
jgi:hypothetical protein